MKLKKGDSVKVASGKDRGREGKIEAIFPKDNTVLILGINQYKKHKKSQGQNQPGEIITMNRPLMAGKVAIICPKCKQVSRIGYKMKENKKVRVCRKCDGEID
jgi:large subunit ribosomal protein L24